MDISALAPVLLLLASFAAGTSGLLLHSQVPRDVSARDTAGADRRITLIGNGLFALAASFLVWAAVAFAGNAIARGFAGAGDIMHKFHVIIVGGTAAAFGWWQRRNKKRKRDGGR